MTIDEEIDVEDESTQSISLHLDGIRELAFNPQRFSEIPMIIVDYAMPEMNGLEFCQKIENSPCNKIMLTGVADLDIAVDGFNKGVIDQFIIKNSQSDFVRQLELIVSEFRWKYFQQLSQPLLDQLALQKNCCLFEPNYKELLQQLCSELQIVKFYLLDRSGSLVLLDAAGQASWLLVKTATELDELMDIARTTDGTPPHILQALEQQQKAPYFYTESDHSTVVQAWERLLHPITKLPGENEFYYTLVQNPEQYGFEQQRVIPYNQAQQPDE